MRHQHSPTNPCAHSQNADSGGIRKALIEKKLAKGSYTEETIPNVNRSSPRDQAGTEIEPLEHSIRNKKRVKNLNRIERKGREQCLDVSPSFISPEILLFPPLPPRPPPSPPSSPLGDDTELCLANLYGLDFLTPSTNGRQSISCEVCVRVLRR